MQRDVRVYFSKETDPSGNPRYRVTTSRPDPGRPGRRKRAVKTFASESLARRIYNATRREAAANGELTVSDLIDRWCEDMARRCQPNTVKDCRRFAEGLCDTEAYAADVTPELAQQWYRAYQTGRSPATHRQVLQVTKALWRWALDEGLVEHDPWRKILKEGIPSRRKKQLRIDESRAFLAEVLAYDNVRAAAAILCGLLLGLRPGEIMAIVGRDVDDGARYLWIPDGKTDNAPRTLTVPDDLRELLLAVTEDLHPSAPLFPYSNKWLGAHITTLCKRAGVPRITAHGLRGTHASLATAAGATSQLVAQALGHGGTAVTERHYIDPSVAAAATSNRAFKVLSGGKS